MSNEIVQDYEKLIKAIRSKKNSAEVQIAAVKAFFKKHPPTSINTLANGFAHTDKWGISSQIHPTKYLIDAEKCKAHVTDAKFKVLKALLEHGMSPHTQSLTKGTYHDDPFEISVKTGDHRTAALLLKHGANSNHIGAFSRPVIFDAVCNNDKKMVSLLLKNKANINIKMKEHKYYDNFKKYNLLGYLYRSCTPSIYENVHKIFKGNKAELKSMLTFLCKKGLNTKARIGEHNFTFRQLIIDEKQEIDENGFNWMKWNTEVNKVKER